VGTAAVYGSLGEPALAAVAPSEAVSSLREMPGAVGDDHDDHDDHDDGHDDDHDDLDEHDAPLGSPPHPMDRVWLHPSELPAPTPVAAAARGRRFDAGHVWIALAAAGAGALVTIALLAAFGMFDDDVAAPTERRERAAADAEAVAQLAADIAPSVVTVTVRTADGLRRGSGVSVRHGGDLLTSERLVRDATAVTVTTFDGEARTATVRGFDVATDVALLHVEGDLRVAPVAEDGVRTGDTVLVVGAASKQGRPPWVGDGIVSSVDAVASQLGGPSMDGLIATDAAPGAQGVGGALLDRKGSVAGIVMMPVGTDPVTYVVPIGLAAKVADDLVTRRGPQHGWLGASCDDKTGEPVVRSLHENGPAQRAGMLVGDVIVSVAGRLVATMGEVVAVVRSHEPRQVVPVKVKRGDKLVNVEVQVGATPADAMFTSA
jgi:S1-C subfamily serine protease